MASEAVKLARLQAKRERNQRSWEREKMLYDKLLTPTVIRLALGAAIIAYSTQITRSKEAAGPVASALALAGPGIGIPLIAADAGIRDKYALAAISAAGSAYAGLSALQGLKDVGVIPSGSDILEDIKNALPEWAIPG